MSSGTMPEELAKGYSRFASNRAEAEQNLYRTLGEGQSPHTLVISCADSRVDPATIFGAAPGELFVIRNVANIVPSCETYSDDPNANLAGTAAALQFAVDHLRVSRIVVMGHGKCGGVAAALGHAQAQAAGKEAGAPNFIDKWVGLMAEDGQAVVAGAEDGASGADLQTRLEHANIRSSMARVQSFDFVVRAMEEGRLTVHGAWFTIGEAQLHWLGEDGTFAPVTP